MWTVKMCQSCLWLIVQNYALLLTELEKFVDTDSGIVVIWSQLARIFGLNKHFRFKTDYQYQDNCYVNYWVA